MLVVSAASWGFVAQGGTAAPGRTAQRASAPRATEQAGFFLLSKLDLAQVRAEREALEKALDAIDRNVADAEILAALQKPRGQIATTHQALKTGSKGSGRESRHAEWLTLTLFSRHDADPLFGDSSRFPRGRGARFFAADGLERR